MDSMMLSEIGGLVLLGSWSLALPAATLTVLALVILGRTKPMSKRKASLFALLFSGLVGTAMILALWALKGGYEDPLSLVILIPGAIIVAMLGAVPAALFVRWMLNNRLEGRGKTAEIEIA